MSMKIDLNGPPSGPLSGIRVVDFATIVSGPLCAQILGDLGADVVKVETPIGDTTRFMGPFRGALGAIFSQVNRNKRGMTVDLKKAEGVEVARRLLEKADVVVENFRPGVTERLGIGYDTLAESNPGLVYVAISGFGPDGPYAALPAYDTVIQGLTGFMEVQGKSDDPQLVRGIVADKTSGLTAAYAVMAALFARERNGGRGQRIDVPMLDAYAAFALPDSLAEYAFAPVEHPPPGSMKMQDIHRTWQTADGHVVMMIIEDSQFQGICKAIDREDLLDDPRCTDLLARISHTQELFTILEEEIAKWPTAELVERARRFGAPLAPANGIADFIEDPQAQANGTVFEIDHESEGTLRQLRNPVRFSNDPTSLRRLPPLSGQHTDEILAELGFDEEKIAALRAERSVS